VAGGITAKQAAGSMGDPGYNKFAPLAGLEASDDSSDGCDVDGSHEGGCWEGTTQGCGSRGSQGNSTSNDHVDIYASGHCKIGSRACHAYICTMLVC
jgi:hypothetical protein